MSDCISNENIIISSISIILFTYIGTWSSWLPEQPSPVWSRRAERERKHRWYCWPCWGRVASCRWNTWETLLCFPPTH